jgi:hypothetical protein
MKIDFQYGIVFYNQYAKVLFGCVNKGQLLVNGRFIEWVTVLLREGNGLFAIYRLLFTIYTHCILHIILVGFSHLSTLNYNAGLLRNPDVS